MSTKVKNKHGRVGVKCTRLTRAQMKRQAFKDGYREGKRVYQADLGRYSTTVNNMLNELMRTSAAARIHARIRVFLERGV